MVKVSRAPKRDNTDIHDETHPVGERPEITSLPNGDKLLAYADELASPAVSAMQMQTNSAAAPMPKRFAAVDAAREAGAQIEVLVRMKVDSVSAVSRSEDGWDVVVNVVELARIPHSTDVLASYNVHLDMEGGLISYNRGNRYTRDQTGDVM
jgi:hypothetical protein